MKKRKPSEQASAAGRALNAIRQQKISKAEKIKIARHAVMVRYHGPDYQTEQAEPEPEKI